MGATETTTQQYITLEHPFNLPLIVLVTLICAAVMVWALYRERRILGAKTTSLFLLLRVLAIATALWMLLAPTSVLEESTSTKKAVVILSDVSASMATVDPAGTADDLRWALSDTAGISDSSLIEPIALADRTIAALGVAHRELSAAISDLEKHGGERLVSEHVRLASKAITRSRMHLNQIRDGGTSADVRDLDTIIPLLARLSTLLESPECDALVDLAQTLQRDRSPSEAGWREGLTDLVGRTAIARRVSIELTEQLSKHASASPDRGVVASTTFQNRARGQRVASLLNQLGDSSLDSIKETADVHWSFFDDAPRDLSGNKEASMFLSELADRDDLVKVTDLSAGLRHVDRMRQDQPVAATFVLSDVAHNLASERKPTEIATQMEGSPVYVVPIGNPSRLRDIDLISTSAPIVAMRNDAVVIEAHLEAYQCLGETCLVQLMQDGQVIDFRNVLIDSASASHRVRFDQRVSEIGTATFQIAVDPLDGEMTLGNNFGEVEINVTRSDIKVLLCDEHPRWEYRYLAQLFRRDDKVEVDELLYHPRVIATGRREETKTFPVTVDQWDQYDVVILGDIEPDHFPAQSQESLRQYLRTRGGTLIMIAGDAAMPHAYVDHPLAEVVPVRPIEEADDINREYSFRVTEQGRSHVALMIGETDSATRDAWDFVNRFSPLHQVSRWRSPLPTARSLIAAAPRDLGANASDAELSDSTFLCWQPVGRGRVVYLAGPDTYRLRFLRGDQLHYRFWGQLMRWAIASDLSAGNRSVRIRTSKTLYETDQTVDVEVELLDSEGNPVIEDSGATDVLNLRLISGEDERMVPLAADAERPGHYRADIRSLKPGVYQAQPGGSLVESLAEIDAAEATPEIASATFTVQADLPTELVDTRCNRVLAGQVAELSGGQVLPPTAVSEIIELTNLDPIVTHRVQRQPLWLRWRYLWLVFGCLQIEWIIRKWRGLS